MINWQSKGNEPIFVMLLSCLLIGLSINTSCSRKSPMVSGGNSQEQPHGKAAESPVALQATAANKGHRCAPRVYSNVGGDEDHNPFCYEVQRRLVIAAREGNLTAMRAALRDGASAEGSVDSYYSPLYTAADVGQTDAVRLLLENGADVNWGDFITGTPLIVAAGRGDTEIVKLLLGTGADVCFKAEGGTAEEFAQKRGHKEIVDLLRSVNHGNCK